MIPQTPTYAEKSNDQLPLIDETASDSSRNHKKNKNRRKPRTTFSLRQKFILNSVFQQKQFLTVSEMKEIAKYVGLTSLQVKICFQNLRSKYRKRGFLILNPSDIDNQIQPSLPKILVNIYNIEYTKLFVL